MSIQSNVSTGEKLLSLINDIELITKLGQWRRPGIQLHGGHELWIVVSDGREILENTIALKHQKLSGPEQQNLTALLVAKDNELKDTLKVATEQAKINQKMDLLRAEVEQQDQDIQQLQRHLKEAEQILATAIFQAKQKLQSINRANKNPVPSEELIKYAHRISASNAVCAPLSWQPGDPRRPYPTDIEMRLGFLGRLNDMPMNGHMMQQAANMPDMLRSAADAPPASQQNQFQWHPSGEIHMAVGSGQGSVPMDTRNHNKDAEDVEVMSTDSSSSSSSDSQ